MQLTELVTAEERVRIYGFLAEVFHSTPTAESLRAVSQMALALGISCPAAPPLGELNREYMDLFVVPNPRYVAPYESAYRDRWLIASGQGADAAEKAVGRLLMGESTLAMQQCFQDARVLPLQDLPDHLANELRLMSHLWTQEANPSDGHGSLEGLRAKVRNEHLLKWIGQLRQKVVEHERMGFYSAALDLVEAMLQHDGAEDAPDRDLDQALQVKSLSP